MGIKKGMKIIMILWIHTSKEYKKERKKQSLIHNNNNSTHNV